MRKTIKSQYLFALAGLLWAAVVFLNASPLINGRPNRIAGMVFFVGLFAIYCVRAMWRWWQGEENIWGGWD